MAEWKCLLGGRNVSCSALWGARTSSPARTSFHSHRQIQLSSAQRIGHITMPINSPILPVTSPTLTLPTHVRSERNHHARHSCPAFQPVDAGTRCEVRSASCQHPLLPLSKICNGSALPQRARHCVRRLAALRQVSYLPAWTDESARWRQWQR